MKKKALITGISGQDGSYLAELLLEKGYDVFGVVRRVSIEDPQRRLHRIKHILDKLTLISGSVDNFGSVFSAIQKVQPDEVYHLAAQSFVHESFLDGFTTLKVNINGTYNILEAIRQINPNIRMFFAGSSEMFGKVQETPQTELTRFYPRSPYGISKVAGFELTRNYRESYGMFCCSGISFNHESPRRGFEFVTRKITSTIAQMKFKQSNKLIIGNIHAKRDWGFAKDYVYAMWLMLQQQKPDDYVLSTNQTHSVKEFIDLASTYADVSLEYIDLHSMEAIQADEYIQSLPKNKNYVIIHPQFFRPAEVDLLLGDYSKAKRDFGWEPNITFSELVRLMVDSELKNK